MGALSTVSGSSGRPPTSHVQRTRVAVQQPRHGGCRRSDGRRPGCVSSGSIARRTRRSTLPGSGASSWPPISDAAAGREHGQHQRGRRALGCASRSHSVAARLGRRRTARRPAAPPARRARRRWPPPRGRCPRAARPASSAVTGTVSRRPAAARSSTSNGQPVPPVAGSSLGPVRPTIGRGRQRPGTLSSGDVTAAGAPSRVRIVQQQRQRRHATAVASCTDPAGTGGHAADHQPRSRPGCPAPSQRSARSRRTVCRLASSPSASSALYTAQKTRIGVSCGSSATREGEGAARAGPRPRCTCTGTSAGPGPSAPGQPGALVVVHGADHRCRSSPS